MTDSCELWLGDSRKLVSDITDPVNCIITDPPYGMDFVSNKGERADNAQYQRELDGDEDLEWAIGLFNEVMAGLLPKLTDPGEVYIFTAWHILDAWMPVVRALPDLELKQMLIWDKGYPGLGDLAGNWGCGHEIILYLKRGRRLVPKRRSGIIHVDKLASRKNVHPTEKPVTLIEHLIEMSTDPGDLIVDPFAGSGSTIVAAQKLGRRGVGIEKDEGFHRSASARLSQPGLLLG